MPIIYRQIVYGTYTKKDGVGILNVKRLRLLCIIFQKILFDNLLRFVDAIPFNLNYIYTFHKIRYA